MTKYAKYQRKPPDRPEAVHPIWRGIGCALIILVPIISYAMTVILIQQLKIKGLIPHELLGYVQFPDWVWNVPIISSICHFLGNIDDLPALIGFFLAVLFILTGIFTTLYSVVYRLVGPPRYSPVDAPPARYKKYTGKKTISR